MSVFIVLFLMVGVVAAFGCATWLLMQVLRPLGVIDWLDGVMGGEPEWK